jgi:hypothetical protein
MKSLQYNSIPTSKSSPRKSKNPISDLAQRSFEAFRPFINLYDPGVRDWKGSPIHTITKEDWRLFRRHQQGERGLIYPDGREFKSWRDVISNIYSAEHVHWHIEGRDITYYTSGRHGLGLFYLDVDAHHPWQTDEYEAKAILQELFPFGYFRASRRGQNGYLKIRYNTAKEFNTLADRLQATMGRYFLSKGILCDFEVKGKITTEDGSGSLAKSPFGTPRYPCNMRDETDDWNGTFLEKFVNCPIVNTRRVEVIRQQLVIDEDKARHFAQSKRHLDESHKATEEAKKTPPRLPVIIKPVAVIQPKTSVKPCSLRAKMDLPAETSGDAFRRNLEDLPPFIRAFYSQYHRHLHLR